MGTRETTQLELNMGFSFGNQLPPARISSRDAATETPGLAPGVFDWRESDWLPPPDVLRPGFQTPEEVLEHRFATPADRHNRVQVDELIEMVKATVDPAYFWPGKVDLHHLQWPFDWYQWFDAVQADSHGAAMHYRELPPNKIMVPRNFHIWLHRVALPPTMPRLKVMRQTIEEWNAQVKFHEEVSETTKLTRVFEREERRRGGYDPTQQAIITKMVNRRMGSLAVSVAAVESIPPERLPWAPDMTLQERAGRIGRLARKGSHLRTRAVRPNVA